jgi:hypothetical protein
MQERFWIPVQTFAADGGARPNPGGTPFRQPCPAYPSTIGQKAPQVRFSEEVSESQPHPETHFSKARLQILRTQRHAEDAQIQQAWMNSRNQTTITIPTNIVNSCSCIPEYWPITGDDECRESGLATRWNASCLLIPSPASTLQIFQFIQRLACA